MTTDLKARLLAPREAATKDVEIQGVGTVTVRALTRGEIHELHKSADNPLHFERKFVSLALLSPEMTEAEVAEWQSIPGALAEIQQVSDAIEVLTGLKAGADKSGV